MHGRIVTSALLTFVEAMETLHAGAAVLAEVAADSVFVEHLSSCVEANFDRNKLRDFVVA